MRHVISARPALRTLSGHPIRPALATAVLLTALAVAAPPRRPPVAAQPPVPPGRPYVRPADRWFGETRAVAAEGDRAYYAVGRAIAVADIGRADGPRLLGRSAPLAPGPHDRELTLITDIAVSGRWLWAVTGNSFGDGDRGNVVAVFDVEDATRPHLQAVVPTPPNRNVIGIAARGSVGVLAYADYGPARGIVTDSGLLAVRLDATGSPHVVGRWYPGDPLNQPYGLAWAGDTLVVNGDGYFGRVRVVDVGDGGVRFEPLGFAVPDGRWNQLAVDGCRVYASEYVYRTPGADEFTVYDVCADPPRRLFGSRRALNSSPEPRDLVKGISAASWGGRNLVFMSDAAGGLWTIDATDPTSITWTADSLLVPVTTTDACLGDTAVAGSRLVVAGCGLAVLAMGDGAAWPHLVGRLRHPPLASEGWDSDLAFRPGIWADNDVILTARMNTLSTIAWDGIAAPAVQGQVPIRPSGSHGSHTVMDIAVASGIAWVADDPGTGVFGFDVADPGRPVRVATVPDSSFPAAIAADGPLLAMAGSGPIQLFDVADPAAPTLVGSLHETDVIFDNGEMFLADGRLFVATRTGLDTYLVRDPMTPTTGPSDHSASLADAALDQRWIVTLGRDAIRVYDRAAAKTGTLVPAALVPLAAGQAPSSEPPRFFHLNLGHVGDRVVAIASNDRSLLPIDITDPAMPMIGVLHTYPAPAESIAVSGDRVYLVSQATADLSRLDLGVLLVGSVLRLPYLANLARF